MGTSLVWAARISLAVLIFLLYYGSLYPGVVKEGVTLSEAWSTLLHSFHIPRGARTIVDVFLNVLVYMPPGFVFVMAVRWKWPWRIAGAVLMGFFITVTVELLQGFIASRDQSLLDCIANTLGAGAGAIAGWLAGEHWADRLPFRMSRRIEPDSIALLSIWMLAQLFPLFPSIGFYKLARKLEALFNGDVLQAQTLTTACEWVIVALIVEKMAGAAAVRWMLLALTPLPLRLFIHMRQVTIAEILGVALGLCFWRFVLFRRPWRHWVGALVIFAGLLLSQLMPLRFANQASTFHWLPFKASLATAEWELALITLTAKAYRYGAMIWIARQCGASYAVGGVLVAVMLFATEMTQRYLPGRTAEIADPLLALLMAMLFWMTKAAAGRRS